jgi:hypothetical protein
MRRAMGLLLLLLAVAAVGVIVGRSIAPPARAQTRAEVLVDLGFDRIVPEVNFQATPLDEAFDFVRKQTSTNLIVHWRTLEAAGIDQKAPITLRLSKLPIQRVLELICDEAGAGQERIDAQAIDGAIVVSTAEDNARYAETKLYDVQDFVQARYDFRKRLGWQPATSQSAAANGQSRTGLFGTSPEEDPYNEAIETLNRMICEFVEPDMWRDAGGAIGSIRDYNGRLMITATPAMHAQIAALLEMLRKGQ